jgi:peptidoglycan/xylan/chitin deacetylase (PgdA/CDA1 family)
MDLSLKWPGGARCAVMLSFDFDAESLWLSRDPENRFRPGTLSQGRYGAVVGVPKIIELLDQRELRATFFIPGWTVENHPGPSELILSRGHEVGHHGYLHEWISHEHPEKEEEALQKGLEALKTRLGVTPRGYRSPAWETTPNMMSLLTRYGFAYDSSMMDHINPYRHVLSDGKKGPVELPVSWSLDDAPFMMFSARTPRTIVSPDHLLSLWKAEFSEIRDWGGLFVLTMHPQFSGRPSRIALLRDLIVWMQSHGDVWFGTGGEIADAWMRDNESK